MEKRSTIEDVQARMAENPALAALNPELVVGRVEPLRTPDVVINVSAGDRATDAPKRGDSDGFDSQLERDFTDYCRDNVWSWDRNLPNFKLCRKGKGWWSYRPDFIIKRNGEVAFVETKPDFIKREARIGELKISLFAAWCHKWGFTFYRVTRSDGQWWFEEQ